MGRAVRFEQRKEGRCLFAHLPATLRPLPLRAVERSLTQCPLTARSSRLRSAAATTCGSGLSTGGCLRSGVVGWQRIGVQPSFLPFSSRAFLLSSLTHNLFTVPSQGCPRSIRLLTVAGRLFAVLVSRFTVLKTAAANGGMRALAYAWLGCSAWFCNHCHYPSPNRSDRPQLDRSVASTFARPRVSNRPNRRRHPCPPYHNPGCLSTTWPSWDSWWLYGTLQPSWRCLCTARPSPLSLPGEQRFCIWRACASFRPCTLRV